MKKIIALVAGSLILGAMSCATTTKIVTDKPGATVYSEKDKKDLGVTPFNYETKEWIWESEKLTVKQDGKQKSIEIKRSEADLLPLGGGICLSLTGCGLIAGVPIILAGGMKAPETTKVTFDEKSAAPAAGSASLAKKKATNVAAAPATKVQY